MRRVPVGVIPMALGTVWEVIPALAPQRLPAQPSKLNREKSRHLAALSKLLCEFSAGKTSPESRPCNKAGGPKR